MIKHDAGSRRDEGFTLIEVLVALLVFAIVSTGIVAGATTVIRMTADNAARITAANLAAQDLDQARSADAFDISAQKTTTYLNSTSFTVTRTVKWISTAGQDLECSGGTALLYLRVNVRVDWAGRLPATAPVQDDTLVAPAGRTSTSGTGSIAVLVKDASGDTLSNAGVSVSAQSGGGGATPTTPNATTTADGCAYINQVTPGIYTVTVTKVGYVDPTGAAGVTTQQVVAGQTTQVPVELDKSASYSTKYVPSPVAYSGTPLLASNMATTFISTNGNYVAATPGTSVSLPSSNSYSVVAGAVSSGTKTCADVDPVSWRADTVNLTQVQQGVRATASGTAFTIPVGVVEVYAPSGVAIAAQRPVLSLLSDELGSLLPDDPGCDVTGSASQLTWSKKGTGGWVALTLPYGSWRIFENGIPVLGTALRAPTNAARIGVTVDGVVTLDPRKAN